MQTLDAAVFAQCEQEPLAHSGSVQPHGALLFLERQSGELRYASANAAQWLGEAPGDLLGQNGHEWIEMNLPDLAALPAGAGKRLQLPQALDLGSGPLDVLVSATGGGWLLEFEPSVELVRDPDTVQLPLPAAELDGAAVQSAQQALVEAVAEVTGYSRVMLYRFHPDWSGEVLAEAVRGQSGAYLGLRFPASDIPAIARSLYAQTPYRHIPDASVDAVAVLSRQGQGTALDLTWADLRSVSPVHLRYLANMGVRSSFSVSVMVDGRLWGLVACHHHEPRAIALRSRDRCTALTADFVRVLQSWQQSVQRSVHATVVAALEPVRAAAPSDWHRVLARQCEDLAQRWGASGGAVVVGESALTWGAAPAEEALRALHQWCLRDHSEPVFALEDLPQHMGAATPAGVCGVLGVSVRQTGGAQELVSMYWFRPEEASEIAWAGNPNKPLEPSADGLRLSPRDSFDKWVQVRHGHSLAWDEASLFGARQLREQLLASL